MPKEQGTQNSNPLQRLSWSIVEHCVLCIDHNDLNWFSKWILKKHLSSLKNNAQRGDEISNSVNVFKEKNNGLRKIYSHNYLIHRSSNSVVYICSYMFSPAHLIWNVCNKILNSEKKATYIVFKKNPKKPPKP